MAEEFSQDPNVESAKDNVESGKSHFQQAASDLKSAASAKADEFRNVAGAKVDEFRNTAGAKAEELRGQAEAAWGDAKVKMRTYQEDGEAYVRENPTRAVVGALAAGFILGLVFRK